MFFLVFFSLYGGFNLIAFLRLKHVLNPDPIAMAVLGGVMILIAEMIRRIPTPHGKYAVTGNHEFYVGLLVLGDNQRLCVSRGTGTWGPPVRFLAPPEVTVIQLDGV